MLSQNDIRYQIEALKFIMSKQNQIYGDPLIIEQVENLKYGIETITPSYHQEFTFIVACAMSHQPMNFAIDEYNRRKKGLDSMGPDHPLLSLDHLAVPDTHRILIYDVQFDKLSSEILNFSMVNSGIKQLFHSISNKDTSVQSFQNMLKSSYKNTLSISEVTEIYYAIGYLDGGFYRPYHWCSTIVNRSDSLENLSL